MFAKEIIEYAIKGLSSDIERSQLTVYRATDYIGSLDAGKTINTPKNITELKKINNKHNKLIDELYNKKEALLWVLPTEY